MRFEVPQFIDVEDKIFGPLTFKQFVYLVGGAALGYVSYKIVPSPLWIIPTFIFVGLGALLAFYRLNNQPFLLVAQSWISYIIKGKRYIWKRTPPPQIAAAPAPAPKPVPVVKQFNEKTITDLAQNLDILDRS
jgi:hypothetical protein